MTAQEMGYGAATQVLKESLTNLSGSIKLAEQAHMAAGQYFQAHSIRRTSLPQQCKPYSKWLQVCKASNSKWQC